MSSANDASAQAEADWDLLRGAAALGDLPADDCVEVGVAHALAGRMSEAAASFESALARQPGHPRAMVLLGPALIALRRHADALAHADRALALAASPEAWIIRGDALHGLQNPEGALASYAEAAKWESRRAEALAKVANQQFILKRYDQALAAYDASLALRPDATVQFDRALLRLTVGDFEGGWGDYEARLRKPGFLTESGGPLTPGLVVQLERNLRADDLRGQRVLVVSEQGIGDVVMFASLFPDLLATGAQVICVCDQRLVGLFSASFPTIRFLDPATGDLRRSDIDKMVDFGELARLFRGRREGFPGRPYLEPRAALRSRWAETLGPRPPGLRIGLSWRGGTTAVARRSVTLDQLAPVLALPGCEFVSLQYGDVEAEVVGASARLGRPIRVFPKAEIDDFEDLAGLIAALDVVVSVQNSVVHVAGAIGQDCLAMLPYNPEWRYMDQSRTMPWYGSVELHRQAAPGDWTPVVSAVAEALKSRLNRVPARS